MRYASVAMALMALCLSTTAFGGQNPLVTFPLHAKSGSTFEACNGYLPVDCTGLIGSPTRPTVNIPAAGAPVAVFLMANNHTALAGAQTAFEWPGWALAFSLWSECQGGQVTGTQPANPGGPTNGTIATAFNCVNSPALQVIGRMFFQPAGAIGCISQVESTFPGGIVALDCNQQTDQIPVSQGARLGKICPGQGGVDACEPLNAVEPATWGSIKGQYN